MLKTHMVKRIKQFSFIGAAFLIAGLNLTGCNVGGSSSFQQGQTVAENNATHSGEPVTGDWVVTNLLDEPEGLNPFTSTSASARYIYAYIYESFLQTERKPSWGDEPLLVEAMPEVSEDHLIYKWKLKENIYYHDGSQMTMDDAVFTLKAIMNPYVDDLPTKPYYSELDSVQQEGKYKLTMFCSQPYFMHLDFFGSFVILPKHVFDSEGLMDDLSFYQVKVGGAYGRIAEYLEANPDCDWDDILPGIGLAALKKTLEGNDESIVKWKDVEAAWGEESDIAKCYQIASELLNAKDMAGDGLKSMQAGYNNADKAMRQLDIYPRIIAALRPTGFPMRKLLQEKCKDIHDRIEKFGRDFNTHPNNHKPVVGSGPYKFDSWSTGQEIVLTRNKDYWQGEGFAYIDKIIWRVLTDYTASLVALKNGEIDFMERLQTIQYLTMTNQEDFLDNFVKSSFIIPSYTYLGWRTTHPIFKDKRVRRAMTHMVRRQDIVDKLLFGYAEIVTSNFYRYGKDYDTTIVPYDYDLEEALRLLTEAGWADVDDDGILEKDSLEFKFEMLLPSGSMVAEQLASILREDLYMIGVEMEIRRLEWSVFINNYIRNKNFDACYLGWVFGLKGDPKQVWHSDFATGRGSNHVQFRNARADSLIDAARIEFDDEKRIAMYREFQQILHEEQPYTFLFSTKYLPSYDKRFKGVRWLPFRPGYQFDEWFVPKEEQKYK